MTQEQAKIAALPLQAALRLIDKRNSYQTVYRNGVIGPVLLRDASWKARNRVRLHIEAQLRQIWMSR